MKLLQLQRSIRKKIAFQNIITPFNLDLDSVSKDSPSLIFNQRNLRKLVLFLIGFFLLGTFSQLATNSTWFTSSVAYISSRNFREVVSGKLYRSGELSKSDLHNYISKYGIKTVIDLRRGGDKDQNNKFSEKNIVESLGATYEWVPLVGTNTHQIESLSKLIALSENTIGPVLIHCSSGTHRSGVAMAIWLMHAESINPTIAAEQLSAKYGFFYWERKLKSWFLGHQTLDGLIWNYLEDYQKYNIKFIDWFNKKKSEL